MAVYLIQHPTFGTIRKVDDCIADARKWAKKALGISDRYAVARELSTTQFCDSCSCAPCCCMVTA